jgi:hypothetical protein
VEPLVKVFDAVVGLEENSGVLPPATEAIVMTVGSYVTVTPYAPRAVVPTSIAISTTNWVPVVAVPGQLSDA